MKLREHGIDLAIGIMSGTSGDGVDAALIEAAWGPRASGAAAPRGGVAGDRRGEGSAGPDEPSDRARIRVLAHRPLPFPDRIREAVLAASADAQVTASDLARLHAVLGDLYAEAALAVAASAPARPAVIGVAGQTLAHLPREHVTLQLGDAARVAARTGIATVADFRSADIAVGGEGAPLTPFADHVLFASAEPRIVLNLGGIANVTLLPDDDPDHVTGWDTGPANMVLDAIARMSGRRSDEDGAGARRGRVISQALETALAHPFFARPGPKSTGREEFGDAFAEQLVEDVRARGGTLDDALATAAALTGVTVVGAIRGASAPPGGWRGVLVGGGGSANPALMGSVSAALAPIPVRVTDDAGVPAQAREAVAFAILALYRMRGLPNTLPRVTGASRAVSAGAIHDPAGRIMAT